MYFGAQHWVVDVARKWVYKYSTCGVTEEERLILHAHHEYVFSYEQFCMTAEADLGMWSFLYLTPYISLSYTLHFFILHLTILYLTPYISLSYTLHFFILHLTFLSSWYLVYHINVDICFYYWNEHNTFKHCAFMYLLQHVSFVCFGHDRGGITQ
jgi:hypothetical protein